jgi:hypothetical protein
MNATRDSNSERKRSRTSVERTLDKFEMTSGLLKAWEQKGTDPRYVKKLRARRTKLQAELRIKGVIFADDDL